MEIVWNDTAVQDIERVRSESGSVFVQNILKQISSLAEDPFKGSIMPEAGLDYMREIFTHGRRITHHIDIATNTITILRVIDFLV